MEDAENALKRVKRQFGSEDFFIQRVNYKFEDGGVIGTLEEEAKKHGFSLKEWRALGEIGRKNVRNGYLTITTLYIDNNLPLSSQLEKLTGDGWNAIDFESVDGGDLTSSKPFRHKKSGKLFVAEKSPVNPMGYISQRFEDGGSVDLTVAKSILAQLGGQGKLRMMTGAYNFIAEKEGVTFRLKNPRANFIKIKRNSLDLYDVEVGRVRGEKYTVVGTLDNAYAEMMKPFIEEKTGLYLSLEDGGVLDGSEFKNAPDVEVVGVYSIVKNIDGNNGSFSSYVDGGLPFYVTNREGVTSYKAESRRDAMDWIEQRLVGGNSFADGGVISDSEAMYNVEIKKTPDSSWQIFNKMLLTKSEAAAIMDSLKDLGYQLRAEVPLPFENGGVVYAKGKVLRENATHKAVMDSGVVKIYEKALPLYMSNAHEIEAHPEWFDDKYLYSVSERELDAVFQSYDEDNRVGVLEYEKEFAVFNKGGNVSSEDNTFVRVLLSYGFTESRSSYGVRFFRNTNGYFASVDIKGRNVEVFKEAKVGANYYGFSVQSLIKFLDENSFKKKNEDGGTIAFGSGGEIGEAPDDFDYQYLKWLKEKKNKKIFFGWW
jgi:hypothetical protein